MPAKASKAKLVAEARERKKQRQIAKRQVEKILAERSGGGK